MSEGTSPVKTVVLFGKTGDGKSTVANMLSSGDLGGGFAAGSSLVAVTKGTVVATNPESWTIIDTEGMLASEKPGEDQKRAEELRSVLVRDHARIDMFCYVKKASRFTGADEQCWKTFLTLLADTDNYHENILLVFTSCSEGPEWVEKYEGILDKHMAGPVPYQKVAVDFPPRSANPEVESELKGVREASLERLKKAVKSSQAKPVVLRERQSSPFRKSDNVWQSETWTSGVRKLVNRGKGHAPASLSNMRLRKNH